MSTPTVVGGHYQRSYSCGMSAKTKKKLPPEERADNDRLKALWLEKHKAVGLTQEKFGHYHDMGQSAVGQYLNGYNKLNLSVAIKFASALQITVGEFSPTLEQELLAGMSLYSGKEGGPSMTPAYIRKGGSPSVLPGAGESTGNYASELERLMVGATPRSRSALEHIAAEVAAGRVTEADLVMLEQIANRFAVSRPAPKTPNDAHKEMKNRLRNDNTSTESEGV